MSVPPVTVAEPEAPALNRGRPRSVLDLLGLLATIMLVLACAVRLIRWAQGHSLWLDEQMVAENLRSRGFGGLAGALSDNQAAPLGWLWLQRAMVSVFGLGEHTLRLVPMAFGVGAVIVAYGFGRRWLNGAGALALVTLIGLNAANINYSDQVKHYSSDMFWALLLLVLAFWVLDDLGSPRRWLTWWGLALVGSWLSLGAILTAPALALILIGSAWRRRRLRTMLLAGLPGVVWLGSFAVHYLTSLRYVTGSAYLTSFWEGLGYPASGSGPVGIAKWFARHVPILLTDTLPLNLGFSSRPVQVAMSVLFCVPCVIGVVVAFRRRIEYGLVIIAAPVSAALLAVLHKVPLSGRLALWMVPALLVAVAFAVDAAVPALLPSSSSPTGRRWAGAGVLLLSLLLVVSAVLALPSQFEEQTLDDRAAVRAMMADHRPGDLTLFVGSAIEAARWYDPTDSLGPSRVLVFTVPGPSCQPGDFAKALSGFQRVVVYAGVRFTGYSDPEAVVPEQLAAVGRIVRTEHYGTYGLVWVVELPAAPAAAGAPSPNCLVVA